MSTALFFMILNIIALGGGPTFVGWLSERLMETHGNVHSLPKDWEEADRRNKEMAAASET